MNAQEMPVVNQVTVLIVDDEDDMRFLMKSLIEVANHGLSVAGTAANGDEALQHWRENRPDVVLLDQRMPGMTGLDTAKVMLSERPEQAVVLYSAFLDPSVQRTALGLGVRACVKKDEARKVIRQLRECVAA
ncbi:MAG: response regulator [Acidimicrobiia bacterium]|nr:response regulator [Acidimicrobiia bacterium]